MLLCELFDDTDAIGIVDRLRQAMLNILTPLASQGVPFVPVDSVIDQLRKIRSGIDVDRGLVMQVLDPKKVRMITKIEGDRIYFAVPNDDTREAGADQKEKDKATVTTKATQQAAKSVKS